MTREMLSDTLLDHLIRQLCPVAERSSVTAWFGTGEGNSTTCSILKVAGAPLRSSLASVRSQVTHVRLTQAIGFTYEPSFGWYLFPPNITVIVSFLRQEDDFARSTICCGVLWRLTNFWVRYARIPLRLMVVVLTVPHLFLVFDSHFSLSQLWYLTYAVLY